ncbi:MAG: potassium channel family protein, partial [Paracoccus sp. (in: a-proteobacteria)]
AFRWAEGWSWLDSIYFSVITISTIGYGDITPKTDAGKVITIFYVLCGLGLFVATASAIADTIISNARAHRDGKGLTRRVEDSIKDRIGKEL